MPSTEPDAFDATDAVAPAVRALIEQSDASCGQVSLRIAGSDDMFGFLAQAEQDRGRVASLYFRAGLSIAQVVFSVGRWRFGAGFARRSVLDFAAGYGRSTRFLVSWLPAASVCAAEIQPEALAFHEQEFGVATMLSPADPADLAVPRQFSLVYASSLFSHLPRTTFAPWLAKLWQFVEPGGVLVVSVRDEALADGRIELVDGFAFSAVSEIPTLSGDEYGVAFTNSGFVRRAMREAIGDAGEHAVRLPRAMNQSQDVWVVCRDAPPSAPLRHEAGPMGALDLISRTGDGLELAGWAGDLGFCADDATTHRVPRVGVHINGALVAEAVCGSARPDLLTAYGRPGDEVLLGSGWTARLASIVRLTAEHGPHAVLTVVAQCEYGARSVLAATTLQGAAERYGVGPA